MPPTGPGDTRVRVEGRAVIGQGQSRIGRARSHSGRIRTPVGMKWSQGAGVRPGSCLGRPVGSRTGGRCRTARPFRRGGEAVTGPRGSPPRSPGRRSVKPDSSSRVGSTRGLPRTSPAISPSAVRRTGAGTGNSVGRCSTRPIAAVTSRFVTGYGAVRLNGPDRPSVSMQMPDRGDLVVQRDERPVLPPVAQPPAEPRPEQREQPPPRPALAGDDQPGPREHRAYPGLLRGRGRRLPLHAQRGQEALSRRARSRRPRGRRSRRSSRSRCRSRRPAAARPARRPPRRGPPCRARRLSRIRFLYASVQRRSPTPAPARLTTASQPASPAASTCPPSGSQRTSSGRPGRAAHQAAPPRVRRRSGTAPGRCR